MFTLDEDPREKSHVSQLFLSPLSTNTHDLRTQRVKFAWVGGMYLEKVDFSLGSLQKL